MFNKNKRKIDSRIRFQNSRFKTQLKQARGYRRPQRVLPKTQWEELLVRVGLGSLLSKIITFGVFCFLVYFTFIPNPLFIKHISITGGDQETIDSAQSIVQSYLKKTLPLPQKNILFLSKNKLGIYLLDNDRKILSIKLIAKHFPNILNIEIIPRVNKYLVQSSSPQDYLVSNDGILTASQPKDSTSTLQTGLILIKINSDEILIPGQNLFSGNKLAFISGLAAQLPAIIKSPVSYFQVDNSSTPDLTVYTKTGFKILFDLNSDLPATLNKLSVLFSQLSDADLKKLSYIDLRFKDKAYVCTAGTNCVRPINIIKSGNTGTTTPN